MNNLVLEIACFNLNSAVKAYQLGVSQLEICENIECGGLTPSFGSLQLIRKIIPVKLKVMIRPRSGNFIYTSLEKESMLNDIDLCCQLGYDGLVSGCLTPNLEIDQEFLQTMVKTAYPIPITFHRAFDWCQDWEKALKDIQDSGCCSLLSSGGLGQVSTGLNRLAQMKVFIGKQIEIIPGGGVRSSNLLNILKVLSPNQVHSSALLVKPNLPMDILTKLKEDRGAEIDEQEVLTLRQLVNQWNINE